MRKDRVKAIPAAYLILIQDESILLLLRQNTGYADGMYSLPAGHVDRGESIFQAMRREAKEELGIDIHLKDLRMVCSMYRNADDAERMDFFLTSDKWFGKINNIEPEKCKELKYFPLNNLPVNIIPYVKEAIGSYLNGNHFVEYGW